MRRYDFKGGRLTRTIARRRLVDRGKTVGRNAAVGCVPWIGAVAIHAAGAALGFWLESALKKEMAEGLGWRQVEGDVMEIALIENPAERASPTPSIAARIERHSSHVATTDSEQRAAGGAPAASGAQDSVEGYALGSICTSSS